MATNQIIVIGNEIIFESNPSLNARWKINKDLIPGETHVLKARRGEFDPKFVTQSISASNHSNLRKTLKFHHLNCSPFPIVIDSSTISKITPFKKIKGKDGYSCEIVFNSIRSHTLLFYYNQQWKLDRELILTQPDGQKEIVGIQLMENINLGGILVGSFKAEINNDEAINYLIKVKDENGLEHQIEIKVSTTESEIIDVKSHYEKLIWENLSYKKSSRIPRVIVPKGIFQFERFLVDNMDISFNPIAIGPDFNKLISNPGSSFDAENFTILSSEYKLERNLICDHWVLKKIRHSRN